MPIDLIRLILIFSCLWTRIIVIRLIRMMGKGGGKIQRGIRRRLIGLRIIWRMLICSGIVSVALILMLGSSTLVMACLAMTSTEGNNSAKVSKSLTSTIQTYKKLIPTSLLIPESNQKTTFLVLALTQIKVHKSTSRTKVLKSKS